MSSLLNSALVVVLLLNLATLGSSRIVAVIRLVAVQGVVLGLLPLLLQERLGLAIAVAVVASVGLKGIIIPRLLFRALEEVAIKREVEPLIGLAPSLFLGALATTLGLVFAARLPLAEGDADTLLVPAALATVLVGFILMTTRRKAISLALGYLVLENGIYIFGLSLFEAMPFLVEVGVLLDLFVGIFVLSIILNHISREFATLDTRHLESLRE